MQLQEKVFKAGKTTVNASASKSVQKARQTGVNAPARKSVQSRPDSCQCNCKKLIQQDRIVVVPRSKGFKTGQTNVSEPVRKTI